MKTTPSEGTQVYPHAFNLDQNNYSEIYIFNTSSESGTYHTDFNSQDGSLQSQESKIPPGGTGKVTLPQGFVGGVFVSGTQSYTSTLFWNLTVSGNQSKVGVQPLLFDKRGRQWYTAVGDLPGSSNLAIAVLGGDHRGTTCEVETLDKNGGTANSQVIEIPSLGQSAQFISTSLAFVGSARLLCDQDVLAVGVIQDQKNGFPTDLSMCRSSGPTPSATPAPTATSPS